MANERVDKWLDLLDRVGWTFIQTFGASIIVLGFNDWRMALVTGAIAAFGSAAKTTVAHQTSDGAGDLIPGKEVIK